MVWLFCLALMAASALGDEERESKDQVEPLRYNPHDRIYKYDGSKRANEILNEYNSPDFSEPTLVLDFRYLRTGGREYVQGPGGQYIILPHYVKSPQQTKFKNFDEFLDYLQQRQRYRGINDRQNYGYRHDDNSRHEQQHDDRRQQGHRHDDHHHDNNHHDDPRYWEQPNHKGHDIH